MFLKNRFLRSGVVLVLGASVIFTGCQNTTTKNTKAVKDKNSADKQVWQVGVIASKTGEEAETGKATIDGIKLAIDEINAAGGINGYEVVYLAMDDESNELKAVNSFNTLKDWGMDFIIGTTSEVTADAVAACADENQILMLSSAVVDDEIAKNHDSLFNVYLSEQDLGADIVQYITTCELGENLAVIAERYNFERGSVCKSFKENAKANSLSVLIDRRFNDDCEYEEILDAVKRCQDKNAEVLFIPVNKEYGSMIFQAAAELGYDPAFVGMEEIGDLMEADTDRNIQATSVFSVSEGNQGNLSMVTFSKKFKDSYERMPEDGASTGYDSIYILKEALEAAGLSPGGVNDETYTALRNAMSTITYTGLIGLDIKWTEDGVASKTLFSRSYYNTYTGTDQ